MLDVLILDGTVVDGSGDRSVRANVAIQNGRIVEVGTVTAEAAVVCSAQGMVVTPGFVDPHSHTDFTVCTNPDADSTIRQGVTTEIVGNCGVTDAPISPRNRELVSARLRSFGYNEPIEWTGFGSYLAHVNSVGTSQNLAYLVGHNTLRTAAGVAGEHADVEQQRAMVRMLDEAMEAGALGLSTGLELGAGRFAPTAEVMRLGRAVGRRGGYYASHIRNRDVALLESVDEFLEIVADGHLRGQISHLNVRDNTGAPPDGWARAVERIAAARARGLDVQADTTPFNEGIGLMTGILPDWVLVNGVHEASKLLRDPAVRRDLRVQCDRYWRFVFRGEWDRVRLQDSPQFPELGGKTFPEIAEALGQDEWECYFDIVAAAEENMDSLFMIGRLFTDEHLAEMIAHPLFSLGVDQFSSSTRGPLSGIVRNPLAFCGHTHYLTKHVRETGTLTLEEAVRKMTSMPAERFGLSGRGMLRVGYWADVAVIDFEQLDDVATFASPVAYARGVQDVFVNGIQVVREGSHTGARPGVIVSR